MVWFIVQSLIVIAPAFLLGLLVGWLWWRRRKVQFGQSQAITRLTGDHRSALAAKQEELDRSHSAIAEKDLEIRRLGMLLSDEPEDLDGLHTAASRSAAVRGSDTTGDGLAGADAAEGDDAPGDEEETAEPEVPAEPEPDDLERIEGIGPRIGAALRGAGITTFRQLADADIATLQSALEQAGLRFAPSLPTWSRQAELLAAGDEDGFTTLTQQLVAGRDISGTK